MTAGRRVLSFIVLIACLLVLGVLVMHALKVTTEIDYTSVRIYQNGDMVFCVIADPRDGTVWMDGYGYIRENK